MEIDDNNNQPNLQESLASSQSVLHSNTPPTLEELQQQQPKLSQEFQQDNNQEQHQSDQKKPSRDTSNDLDWFAKYPTYHTATKSYLNLLHQAAQYQVQYLLIGLV
ncbi:25611_t:CDS:2 [Gigaspora rosea]|nr:25611_t:CDS:2 [Gigaspora rosea]